MTIPAAPEWVKLVLKLATAVTIVLGSFVGGENRGEEAALPRALEVARRAVSEKLEDVTFRALDAEAEVRDRPPSSVVVHLATVIAELEAKVSACQN